MANSKLNVACYAGAAASVCALIGYIVKKANDASERKFKAELDQKEKDREAREKREQREHDLEIAELEGMTGDQKYELKQKELEVRKLEAEAKEAVIEMKDNVVSDVVKKVEGKLKSIAHDEVCDIFKGFKRASQPDYTYTPGTLSFNINTDN